MLATAELYEPATGSPATGAMSTTRAEFAAAILADGSVLVAGGFDVPGTGKPLSSAEIYDPATGAWRDAGSMDFARTQFTATRLQDGRVLVTGGSAIGAAGIANGTNLVSASTEIYMP
jgi:hypothetical protein